MIKRKNKSSKYKLRSKIKKNKLIFKTISTMNSFKNKEKKQEKSKITFYNFNNNKRISIFLNSIIKNKQITNLLLINEKCIYVTNIYKYILKQSKYKNQIKSSTSFIKILIEKN